MRPSEHRAFAKFTARIEYVNEMTRRGIQRDLPTELMANYAIDWLGNNVGILPDWLEPGYNIHHRSICRARSSQNWWWDVLKLMALSAYQSHIWLDSKTPMGVPDYQPILQALGILKTNQINTNPVTIQNNW
jgi:hypothetical protein